MIGKKLKDAQDNLTHRLDRSKFREVLFLVSRLRKLNCQLLPNNNQEKNQQTRLKTTRFEES